MPSAAMEGEPGLSTFQYFPVGKGCWADSIVQQTAPWTGSQEFGVDAGLVAAPNWPYMPLESSFSSSNSDSPPVKSR